MKKVLLFGYYGENNLGDDLLLESLINALQSKFLLGILVRKGTNLGSNFKFRVFNKFSLDLLKGILWSDVVVGGGGGLFQDKTSFRSFYYYLLIVLLSLILKRKVFLLGQSFSPLKNRFHEFILKEILNHCEDIYVRDSLSKDYLVKIGINPAKIKLSTDLSLLIDFPNYELEANILGLNLRQWYNFKGIDLENLVTQLLKKFEKIYFFSMQPHDSKLYYEILRNYKSKTMLISANDPDFWRYFSSCRLFIGMRLHSCIISMSLGIPFVAIVYDEKVKAFCKEIDWNFFVENFELDKILYYIEELEKNYLKYKELLLLKKNLLKSLIKRDLEHFESILCSK